MTTAEDAHFYSLIDTHDVPLIKSYYKKYKSQININRLHPDGETVLHKAIGIHNEKVLRFVMRLTPNIEVRSTKSWTPLHKAVHEDNLVAVKILLAHNANVDCQTLDYGKTPLHLAVFNDSIAIATSLLNCHADPNLTIKSGAFQDYSALHIAVVNNNLNMVELLLWHGTSTEVRCHMGYTALWLAVTRRQTQIVECLCEHNADCNSRPTAGPYKNRNPLFAAIELNQADMVAALIHNSANVNGRDDTGWTPLHHAVYHGYLDVVRLLVGSRALVNVYAHGGAYKGSSPLHVAVQNKNFEMVKWLLRHKANVNARSSDGCLTPLHTAVKMASLGIAKVLLQHKAKVNVRDQQENTPLHYAVQIGDIAMVELLVKNGAKVDVKNSKGKTPLFLACSLKHKRIVIKLLLSGGNPNIENNSGNYPLHVAVWSKQLTIVVLLIQCGANVNVENNRYQTPLYFALKTGHIDVIKTLLNEGAEFSTKCIPKSSFGYFEYITGERTLRYLIGQGVDVNYRTTEGETALHRLIQVSIMEVMLFFKSYLDICSHTHNRIYVHDNERIIDELAYLPSSSAEGRGVHSLDGHHFNAIQMAIHKRAVDLFRCSLLYGANYYTAIRVATNHKLMTSMFSTLLESGADIEAADKNGYTPLHLATKCKRHGYMTLLLQRGARVDPEDDSGYTPMMLAIRNLDKTAITILLHHGATGTFLSSVAWKFCEWPEQLPDVLIRFEYAKRKFTESGNWPQYLKEHPLEKIVNACKVEIENLSQENVGDSTLDFIGVVDKSVQRLVPYVRNSEIRRVLDSRTYRHTFPIYADNIKVKVALVERLYEALQRSKAVLYKLFDRMIPCLIVDEIISYLNDADHETLSTLYKGFY